MIIKSTRIRTAGGPGAWLRHVFEGRDNERVAELWGTRSDVLDAFEDAQDAGVRYGLRHWVLSPGEQCSRAEAEVAVRALADEFGFDPRRAVVVEHWKKRAGEAGFDRHWHVGVPEYDPVTGRVLGSSWDSARHEKVARVLEVAFGHGLTLGRHTGSVLRALEQDGRPDVAEAVRAAGHDVADLPESAFSHTQHQRAKRQGQHLPDARVAVRQAWQTADSATAFSAAIAESGLAVRPGDKPGIWVVTDQAGDVLGAVHRLAGIKLQAARERLQDLSRDLPPPDGHPAPQALPAALESRPQEDPRRVQAPSLRVVPGGPATASPAVPRADAGRRGPRQTEGADGQGPGRAASAGGAGVPHPRRREHDPRAAGGQGQRRAAGGGRPDPGDARRPPERRGVPGPDRASPGGDREGLGRPARPRRSPQELAAAVRAAQTEAQRQAAARLAAAARIRGRVRATPAARRDLYRAAQVVDPRLRREAALRRLHLVETRIRAEVAGRPTNAAKILAAAVAAEDRRFREATRREQQAREARQAHARRRPPALLGPVGRWLHSRRAAKLDQVLDLAHEQAVETGRSLAAAEAHHRPAAAARATANADQNRRSLWRADVLHEAARRITDGDELVELAAAHGDLRLVADVVRARRDEERAERERLAAALRQVEQLAPCGRPVPDPDMAPAGPRPR